MIIYTSISNQKIERVIRARQNHEEQILASAILIAYEQTGFKKVQFNLRTDTGSMHLEYKDALLTYYYRGDFSFSQSCTLSVSAISEYANAYSSHVASDKALNTFSEFLRVSEQRNSKLVVSATDISRIDQLPPTRLQERNLVLPNAEISIVKGV